MVEVKLDTKIDLMENSKEIDRNLRAIKLLKETKLLNFARLVKMLVDLFGIDDQFQKTKAREGQQVEMVFPPYDGSITFTLSSDRKKFECSVKEARNPEAKIRLNVPEEEILKVCSKIIRAKANLSGLLKIAKLFLVRKVKIEGSFMAALALAKCLMIGKHDIYKKKK